MASAVASASKEIPKPVFLMDILASPSASGSTAASVRHLCSTGGAPPRSSSDGVKDSTSGKDAAAATAAAAGRSTPKLLIAGGGLDRFPEAAMRDLLLALSEDGGPASMAGFSSRGFWVSMDDAEAMQLKVALPGLGKEHVKMRAEKDVLVIKGEGDKDSEGDGDKAPPRYSYRIGISTQAFKMDQIKAEMKNGVLSLTLPKIKDEERKDVFEIKVE